MVHLWGLPRLVHTPGRSSVTVNCLLGFLQGRVKPLKGALVPPQLDGGFSPGGPMSEGSVPCRPCHWTLDSRLVSMVPRLFPLKSGARIYLFEESQSRGSKRPSAMFSFSGGRVEYATSVVGGIQILCSLKGVAGKPTHQCRGTPRQAGLPSYCQRHLCIGETWPTPLSWSYLAGL